MAPSEAGRRLAAILFTDIVGYTALMGRDEAAGRRARERHREIVVSLVQRYRGESIEARGDETLSVFPSTLDAILFGRPWGFSRRDIRVPVHMGYGDSDVIVPIGHGEHMAGRIPHAVLRTRPEEGHLGGLGASHEIFDAILAHWDESDRAVAE